METLKLVGVKVNNITKLEMISEVESLIDKKISSYVVTPYSEFFLKAQNDTEFKKVLNNNFINILSDEKVDGYPNGQITEDFIKSINGGIDKLFYLKRFLIVKCLKLSSILDLSSKTSPSSLFSLQVLKNSITPTLSIIFNSRNRSILIKLNMLITRSCLFRRISRNQFQTI